MPTRLLLCLVILAVAGPVGARERRRPDPDKDAKVVQVDLPRGDDGPKVVALLPFTGAEAAVPPRHTQQADAAAGAARELLLYRAAGRYRVLPVSDWTAMARKRFRGKTTELQAIAEALGADLVVGGWLQATPDNESGRPYRLTLAVYNNWAEPLGQVALDLDNGQRLALRAEPYRLADLCGPFFELVEHNLGLLEKKQPEKQEAKDPTQADDKEAAPLQRGPGPVGGPLVPPTPEARELYYQRQPWRPIFDVSAGYLANIRHFTDDGSGRVFNTSAGHGVRLGAEVYPLAGIARVPDLAAGLGLRLGVDLPFWKDVRLLNELGEETGRLEASEYRVEVGWLRWHYNPWNSTLRPDFEVEGLYGLHRFYFTQTQNILVQDIASVSYSYLGASFGARLYLARRMSVRLGLAFAGLLDLGPISEPGAPGDDPIQAGRSYRVYGPGSGWLWRLQAQANLRLVAGLTAGIGFYYEQNRLSFEGSGDVLRREQVPGGPPQKVLSAVDEFGGIFLTLGYVY